MENIRNTLSIHNGRISKRLSSYFKAEHAQGTSSLTSAASSEGVFKYAT